MKKFDDMDWHSETVSRLGLSPEKAAVHIGVYVAWAIRAGLISDALVQEHPDRMQGIRNGTERGSSFLINCCDGAISEKDFTDEGNRFTRAYYEKFFGYDMDEYSPDTKLSFYELQEDDLEARIGERLSHRLQQWREGIPFDVRIRRPWWKFW